MYCPSCQTQHTENTTRCTTCGHVLKTWLQKGFQLQGGKYTIGKVLGKGGFGITYLGANTLLGMPVAIKELFPDGSGRGITQQVLPQNPSTFQEEQQRFLMESRALAQFKHPGIVGVHDLFQENGTSYLVMELLRGQTLAEKIQVTPLDAHETLETCKKLLDALEVVHSAGLLHRDIKPENIFITTDARVVLIDFGTARQYQTGQTSNHTRLLTPGYAPLEQYSGAARVGPYTDLYALGATLYHALLGEAPPAATDRINGVDMKALPLEAMHPLTQVILHCLQVAIKDRPQEAAELKAQLMAQTHQSDPPASTHPEWNAEKLYQKALQLLASTNPTNQKEALALLHHAAEKGLVEAQNDLGDHHARGKWIPQDFAQAFHWYSKAAEQGSDKAQACLGMLHEEGKGTPRDFAKAVHWYRKSAEQGFLLGQYKLAGMVEHGKGTPKDFVQAFDLYQKVADHGLSRAQACLGMLHEEGKGTPKDFAQAVHWYRKAAAQGLPLGQYKLAEMFEHGKGVAQNLAEAARWYRAAAEQGHPQAQYNLAWMHQNGRGVQQDFEEALIWYRKAAEQGHGDAQTNLGLMYNNAIGVDRDDATAVDWYRKAAQQGNARGQTNLGLMYKNGTGVLKDDLQATYWFQKAAAQGNPSAQNSLGVMRELAEDFVQAAHWYRKAAEQDEMWAQHNLGLLYEKGAGVEKDLIQARYWYAKAAASGHETAPASLARVNKSTSKKKRFGLL